MHSLPRLVNAADVQKLLWNWDPAGFQKRTPAGSRANYDDLIEPLIDTLAHQPTTEELATGLREVLTTAYGLLSPQGCELAAAALLQLPCNEQPPGQPESESRRVRSLLRADGEGP